MAISYLKIALHLSDFDLFYIYLNFTIPTLPMSSQFNTIPSDLSLIDLWQQQFSPITSLLADISHLSISQVQQALPHLIKIVSLQLNTIIRYSTHSTLLNDLINGTSATLPLSDLYKNISQTGMGFAQIHRLESVLPNVRALVFDDTLHYHRLLGLLSDRTAITLIKNQKLLDWILLLCLISLHQIIINFSLSSSQLVNWLNIQPFFGFESKDDGLLTLYNLKFSKKLPPAIETIALTQKPLITAIFNSPNTLAIFSIAPFISVKPSYTSSVPTQKEIAKAISPSVFTPLTSNRSLFTFLQKYWIATSIVLTAVIFGSISLFTSSTFDNKSSAANTKSTEKPIYDVAILKVESSPAPTVAPLPKTTSTNKVTLVKTSDKKPKTAVEKSDNKIDNDKKSKSSIKADANSKNSPNKLLEKNLKNKSDNKKLTKSKID